MDRISKDVNEVLSSRGRSPVPSPVDNRTLYYEYWSPPESDIWLIELPVEPQ